MNFTLRQQEIINLLLEACTTKEIAARLDISPNTVKVHMQKIFAKAGVGSRVALVSKIMEREIRGANDARNRSELLKQQLIRKVNAARTGCLQAVSQGFVKQGDSSAAR